MARETGKGGLDRCITEVNGRKMRIVIEAENRPGLLLAIVQLIVDFDKDMNIEDGFAIACDGTAWIVLIVKLRQGKPNRLEQLAAHIHSKRESIPGSNMQSMAIVIDVHIDSPNEPGGLAAICAVLAQMQIDIARLLIESDGTEAEGQPYNLSLQLLLPDGIEFALIQENLGKIGVDVTLVQVH